MGQQTVAIEVSGLCKVFDGATAVDHLSFQVYNGEIFGLLGPNGAGKEHDASHVDHAPSTYRRARHNYGL